MIFFMIEARLRTRLQQELYHVDICLHAGKVQGRTAMLIRRIHVFLIIEGDTRSNDPSFVIQASTVQFRHSLQELPGSEVLDGDVPL